VAEVDPEASERKLRARRANERVKLLSVTLNALALGVIGAGVIVPAVSSPAVLLEPARLVWILVGAALHCGAQMAFQLLRSED
jgi:hypothetical protein